MRGGHRPPATGHRPATTTSQHPRPPATGQRPATTTSQHPRPPANGHRPTASHDDQPASTATGHRPTATGHRPTATGHRPATTTSQHPRPPATATGQRPPATGQPRRPASIHAHRPTATGQRPTGHRPPATRTGQDKISQSPQNRISPPKHKKDDFEALCKKIFKRKITSAMTNRYRSLNAATPIRFMNIYDVQLQKTIVLRMQPRHQATLTQAFQCDLQRLSCKAQ